MREYGVVGGTAERRRPDSRDTHGSDPGSGEGTVSTLSGPAEGYSSVPRPLAAYAQLMALFNLAFALFLALARRTGRPVPERIAFSDILLLGLATFKLSRLVTKDIVTSPLRAPFTTFRGFAGEGEVKEDPRGSGMQLALGELLTCPFCMATWLATLLAYGLILSPPLTRLVASILATQAVSDFLQLGFGAAAEGSRSVSEAGE